MINNQKMNIFKSINFIAMLFVAGQLSAMGTITSEQKKENSSEDGETITVAQNSDNTASDDEQQGLSIADLGVNDVSILFPLPQNEEDLAKLISIKDLGDGAGNSVLPESDFNSIVTVAENSSSIGNRSILLRNQIKDFSVWKIAGIRFDPSAPGSSEKVIEAFGSLPQIRLIIQPVTLNGTRINVHDVAMHIIYDYHSSREQGAPGTIPKSIPDEAKVKSILDDLVALKSVSLAAGVDTNKPLGIHPALAENVENFEQNVADFLSTHLSASRFNSGAIMGLDNGGPEPWLFLSMTRSPENPAQFRPVPSPGLGSFAVSSPELSQMVSFIDTPRVQPAPSTTNLMDISNSVVTPEDQRRGVSTAVLFTSEALNEKASIGVDSNGVQVRHESITNADVVDIVANPEISHFFNTDCISCHTETTRKNSLSIPFGEQAFTPAEGVQGLSEDVSPGTQRWNVRNFGWFRSQNTITLRTANETAEVVEFIRTELANE